MVGDIALDGIGGWDESLSNLAARKAFGGCLGGFNYGLEMVFLFRNEVSNRCRIASQQISSKGKVEGAAVAKHWTF